MKGEKLEKIDLYEMKNVEKAWCPGCGNYALHKSLRIALAELDIPPNQIVLTSGIGQAAKMPQYIRSNMFNGLHGRSLPPAMAINAANPELTVIAYSGDGCNYGEGGNHFLHQITRNPNITHIVSDNQIYGLTKNQASPTSLQGMKTTVQVFGVTNEPFNPIAVALAMGATFIARIFVKDQDKTVKILKEAIKHKGYALVDAFSPCVSFNKLNTYKWYHEHTYYVDENDDYNHSNKVEAFKKALETDPYPLGIIYRENPKPTFIEQSVAYQNDKRPLFERRVDKNKLLSLLKSYK